MFTLSKLEWMFLAAALMLVPGWSWSADPAQSLFERLDRDKDGYLTEAELTSDEARNRNWIAVDRDGDGRISRAEFGLVAAPAPKPQPGDAAAGATQKPKQE